MKNRIKKILLILLCGIGIYSAFAIAGGDVSEHRAGKADDELIYPIASTYSHEERERPAPVDLQEPDNVKTSVEYDPLTGHYIFRTRVGDEDVASPYVLNSDEYREYSMQRSMNEYWRQKNAVAASKENENEFNLMDMQFDIGRGDEIFGPGGIQVKTQGEVGLKFGLRKNKVKNPTLPVRSQNPPPTFDFDQDIRLSVRGSVGTKIGLEINYNTGATFDYDASKIKLAYQGDEDEIIQSLEAGHVSMPLSSSLIQGNSSLFGIKTQLKFGKLTIDGVISQQESESQSVSMRNGAQMTEFEIDADQYDENRHFFLAHYFRDNYERAMSNLPHIRSAVQINRVDVWVTNKRRQFDQARTILALADLAEGAASPRPFPDNSVNGEYTRVEQILQTNGIDNINDDILGLISGTDYEKVTSARLLFESEYTLNKQLGYISLKAALNPDEVLAVAYEFEVGGRVYRVGELSRSNIDTTGIKGKTLIVKMLKSTNIFPQSPTWDFMMKNVYSLDAYQLQPEKFMLNIMYQSDSIGVFLNYLPNTPLVNRVGRALPLLSVMELDKLDARGEPHPDGFFDYVEGYTVLSSTGKIIFPVLEPFGSHLRKKLGNDPAFDKYIFQELYDSTLIVAQEFSEKNKYRLKGKYKASTSGAEIRLNAMNIPRGSVTVMAGGVRLLLIPFNAAIMPDSSSAVSTLLSSLKPSAMEIPPPIP